MKTDAMHVVCPRSAGLDVHKMEITATVRLCDGDGEPVMETRCFSTLPSGLEEMVAWLSEHGVEAAVMEGTGVYWQAPFAVLQAAGIEAILRGGGRRCPGGSAPASRRRLAPPRSPSGTGSDAGGGATSSTSNASPARAGVASVRLSGAVVDDLAGAASPTPSRPAGGASPRPSSASASPPLSARATKRSAAVARRWYFSRIPARNRLSLVRNQDRIWRDASSVLVFGLHFCAAILEGDNAG